MRHAFDWRYYPAVGGRIRHSNCAGAFARTGALCAADADHACLSPATRICICAACCIAACIYITCCAATLSIACICTNCCTATLSATRASATYHTAILSTTRIWAICYTVILSAACICICATFRIALPAAISSGTGWFSAASSITCRAAISGNGADSGVAAPSFLTHRHHPRHRGSVSADRRRRSRGDPRSVAQHRWTRRAPIF